MFIKSKNIFKKLYFKGSKILYMSATHNMNVVQIKLIELFSTIFIHRTDRGYKYFQGDFKIMKGFMDKMIDHYDSIYPIITDNLIIEQKYKASIIIQKHWRSYQFSKKNKNKRNLRSIIIIDNMVITYAVFCIHQLVFNLV